MLADREHIEPDLVRATRDLHDRLDALRFAGGVSRDRVPSYVTDGEDSELHRD